MFQIRKILVDMLRKIRSMRKTSVFYQKDTIFSLPIEDSFFQFNNRVVVELKKFVKNNYDISLSEIIVLSYIDIIHEGINKGHTSSSKTQLYIVLKGEKYIGILTISNNMLYF